MKMLIYNTILTTEGCKFWVSQPYWDFGEAIMLSMGLDPHKEDKNIINEEQAKENGDDFFLRMDTIGRAITIDQKSISPHLIPSRDAELRAEGEKENVFKPSAFTKWAVDDLPTFPNELTEEVGKRRAHKKESPGGNRGSDARWFEKREIIAKAVKYVKKSLEDGCIYCDHFQLSEYMYNNASDDQGKTLFEYPNIEHPTLLKYIKDGARKALSKHPKRIVGIQGYKKSDGLCDVHTVKR